MASQSYPTLGFTLLQEQGSNEIIKRSRGCLVNHGGRKQEILPEISFNMKPQRLEPWKLFSKSNHIVQFDSTMMKPRLMDIQEIRPEPLRLSLGITEHYARQEEVLAFLLFISEELEEEGFDMPMLSESMDLQSLKTSSQLPYASSSVLYLNQDSAKRLFYLMLDKNTLFSSSRVDMNDMVSIAAEFHMLRNSARWRKLSRLVPQFQRFDIEEQIDPQQLPAVKLDAATLPPLKRLKPSPKNDNPKTRDRENDLYKRNHLHACEILISLMIEQHRQTTMTSLKKSRGELSELLTRLSIGIAGTGIAVLFSLVCNVASRRIPFCANMFFDSAVSLSLVLLSWAVRRLREAIVDGNKKAIKEDEIINKVEKRIEEVFVRAATVIIMVALRFG